MPRALSTMLRQSKSESSPDRIRRLLRIKSSGEQEKRCTACQPFPSSIRTRLGMRTNLVLSAYAENLRGHGSTYLALTQRPMLSFLDNSTDDDTEKRKSD